MYNQLIKDPTMEGVLVGLTRDGVSVKDRKIYLPTITSDAPLIVMEFIDYILRYGDEKDKDKPITLVISSYGGDSYGMFGVIDVIQNAPMPVNTLAVGPAFSAGAWILAAGTGERMAYENSFIMIHQLRGDNEGTMHEMTQTTNHYKQLQKLSEDLLAKFTNKDSKYWRRVCKKEFYIDAEKAKELGIIDRILK